MSKDSKKLSKRALSGRQDSHTDLLPQSVAARNPSTSYSTTHGSLPSSRNASMVLRQRSGMSIGAGKPKDSSTWDYLHEEPHIKEKDRLPDLSQQPHLMPTHRVCFPYWTGYLATFLFIAFFAGFFTIGSISFSQGRPSRLTHPTDMFGFTCGEINSWNDIEVDLRDKELLYWLDPFELTNPRNRWFAKGICVSSCPTSENVCRMEDVPCTESIYYRCPYYAISQDDLYGTIPYEEPWGTNYFAELAQTSKAECWITTKGLPEVFDKQAGAFIHEGSEGSQQCGEFYQLTSQYPGTGPCYAIWAYSKIQLNHCIPVFPPEVDAALLQYKISHPNDTRLSDPLIQPISGWDIGIYVLDMINGWELIVFSGFVLPTILALISLLLMQKSPAFVISTGVIFCILTFTADTLMSFVKGGEIGSLPVGGEYVSNIPDGANSARYAHKLWIAIGSLLAFATLGLFVLSILLRQYYGTVIKIFKVTARVVAERPLTLIFPFFPLVVYSGLGLFWIWSSIYLYTSADVAPKERSSLNSIVTWWNPNSTLPIRAYELLNLTAHPSNPEVLSGHPLGTQTYADPTVACAYNPDCYLAISFDILQKNLFTYNYFGFWLANEFITTVTGVCVAFYMSHHYFILPSGTRPRPLSLLKSVLATWLALPPLIVGTFMNACLDWFVVLRPICAMIASSRAKRRPRDPLEPKIKTLILAPFRGVGWLASKLTKYTDRQGYFCGALYNKSYWQGCRLAANMAEDGKHHLSVSMKSASSVFVLCKGAITGFSTLLALCLSLTSQYSRPYDYPNTYLTNAVFPVFICILSSYFIAELWSQVYEATLSILLLGYCIDCRAHHGRAKLSPSALIDALQEVAAREAVHNQPNEFRALPEMKSAYQLETLPHEEMNMDPRNIGIESNRRTGKSLNMQL